MRLPTRDQIVRTVPARAYLAIPDLRIAGLIQAESAPPVLTPVWTDDAPELQVPHSMQPLAPHTYLLSGYWTAAALAVLRRRIAVTPAANCSGEILHLVPPQQFPGCELAGYVAHAAIRKVKETGETLPLSADTHLSMMLLTVETSTPSQRTPYVVQRWIRCEAGGIPLNRAAE